MRFRFPVLHNPEIQGNFEQLEELTHLIQYGFVVLEWPGGTQEAGAKKVKLRKTSEGRVGFLQGFASGQFFLPFINSLSATELNVGCATTDHSTPPAGTKQTIAWLVISPE